MGPCRRWQSPNVPTVGWTERVSVAIFHVPLLLLLMLLRSLLLLRLLMLEGRSSAVRILR
jgi:hypothetical protein